MSRCVCAMLPLAAASSTALAATSATTATVLEVVSGGSTATIVSPGSMVTLSASVSAGGTPLTRGQVRFCDATAPFCTDIHLLGTAQLTTAGTATLPLRPAVGTHLYKAVFLGTATQALSESSAATLGVTGDLATTTTLASSGSVGSYNLTATVSGTASIAAGPSGTLSLVDTNHGAASIGSATLMPGTRSFLTSQVASPAALGGLVKSADLNGDGRADLISIDVAGNLQVSLGAGDGTFLNPIPTALSGFTYIEAIESGDFNADGKIDLAIIGSQDLVVVLLGNGDGTFTAGSMPPTGSFPTSLAVADFNGDGNADIAVSNDRSNTISILLGNGDGTFTAGMNVPTGGGPGLVRSADLNGDGVADLAVLTLSDYSVTILLGHGDGSFTQQAAKALVSFDLESFLLADFNGDGKVDLLAPPLIANAVSVYLGNGDGSFASSPVSSPVSLPGEVALGDFNGDGIADVAVGSGSTNSTVGPVFLLGNGDGSFNPYGPFAGTYTPSLTVADWNGDGLSDLAFVNSYTQNGTAPLDVLLSQSVPTATATFHSFSLIGSGTHQVSASYGGDVAYSASASDAVALTGQAATTTLTLTANPPSVAYGQPVVLTATLSPSSKQGFGTDGETLRFFNGGASLGTGTLTSGIATLPLTSLPVGTQSLTATYAGDSNFAGAQSNALSFVVSRVVPTLTWATPAPIGYGTALGPAQLNATAAVPGSFVYSPTAGMLLPAGTQTLSVTFTPTDTTNEATATATVDLVVTRASLAIGANNVSKVFGTANPAFSGTLSGAVNGDVLTESYSTTASTTSSAGTYAIVPAVAGSGVGNYTVNATNGVLTVTQAASMTTLALAGSNLMLTAAVASPNGVPTGTVAFFEGSTLVGNGTLSNGTTSYTLSGVPAANVSLSAKYSGDANFMGSTSSSATVLTVAPASTSLTLGQAASTTDVLTLGVAPGYAGTVQFTCSGLPASATCSFAPASLAFSGVGTSGNVTLTIQTGVTTARLEKPQAPWSNQRNQVLAAVFGLPWLLIAGLGSRRRRWTGLLMITLCVAGAGLIGCSGGSQGSTGPTMTATTPTGTSNVVVTSTGTGGLSLTTNVTLIVQ